MKHVTLLFLLSLFWTSSIVAQESLITGRITDSNDGSGLIGASVLVKGTTIGTISDVDGNYSLKIPSEDVVLVFSCIGYQTQEKKPLSGMKQLNIQMTEDVEVLEDVVIIGYGVTKKALVTGANLNVKGNDVAKLNTTSAMEALQGIAPGVTVTRNNGAPGAGTKVTIRGLGTIGNSNPLYIVDGVAVNNIDYLSTNDIESIDVLKDAASSAIYGSRAANGVVLVTTKKGKKNSKASISYDGYFGIQNIYRNVPVLNAQEYMYIMDESRLNDGLKPHDWRAELMNNSWLQNNHPGKGVKLGEEIWDKLQNGWEGTNWIDEMTKENSPMENHSINIVGGAEDVAYSFGFSYFDQTGIIGGELVDAGYRRLTARMNTEVTLIKNSKFDVLKLGENLTYTNTQNRSVATGNIYYNDLHNAIVQNPLMPAYWSESPDKNKFTPTLEGLANDQHNPLAVMYYGRNFNWGKGNGIVGNVYAELQPMKDLKYRSTFGLNAWFGHGRSWTPTYQLGIQYGNAQDAAQQDMYQGVNYTWTNTLTYHYEKKGHSVDLLGGMEMLKNGLNMNVGGRKIGTLFGKPDNAYLDNANKTELNGIDTWGRDWGAQGGGLLSYIGRASYNYMGKYMADVTIRHDGSSNFAKGNRWGTFPSFSAGWNFTEEAFMKDLTKVMDYGKLRASWGQNGNQAIDNFIYTSNILYLTQGYFFGDTKPISGTTGIPANVPNKDVTWETSEQLNFGIDTRFFDSRLSFSFDWYKKVTKDWLVIAPILGTAGAGAPWVNGGDIENKGIEFSLGWNDNISDFRYGITVTGAHNKNKVTKLANA
ncbi:MAG: SusC/RagA family TonB-linked outer membrane protein, partial [Bacteroidales bacterium]